MLGANAHIKMIGQMIVAVANDPTNTIDMIKTKIDQVANYFKSTRGQQSRAIYNAIELMMPLPSTWGNPDLTQVKSCILAKIDNYAQKAESDMETIVNYADQLTLSMDSILVFDYSSTVNAFLEKNSQPKTVYIPESRALDGGHPFVSACIKAGHTTHFIPDTAMLHVLPKCQAAFIGAETFYPDGSVFNTIGSDILAVLCNYSQVPLYVLTPMLKIDTRPVFGYIRTSPMPYDFSNRLASHWTEEERNRVDFSGIKLLLVPPILIKAFITERGIIPTNAMFGEAFAFEKELQGE